jgi:acetyl-CoA carboxylase carboxyl transferase beta subunit
MAVTVEIARRTPGPEPIRWTCRKCGHVDDPAAVKANLSVCPACGDHLRIGARERIEQLVDPGSFVERWSHLRTLDPLSFNDLLPYPERFREAQAASGLNEALVSGPARIGEVPCMLTVMDFYFMGGSMGSVVGERLWRACEAAAAEHVPLVSVASSGGARMQEGAISLMQMAKTTCAVDLLNEARVPFVVVMADPCTGGVVASFASLADICIAEPGALLYFSGPRVIAETTKEKLPDDFGTAERNLALGHLDAVVPRRELRETLATYLRLLRGGGQGDRAHLDRTSGGVSGGARQGARGAGRMAEGAARRAGKAVSNVGRVVLGRDRPAAEPGQDS